MHLQGSLGGDGGGRLMLAGKFGLSLFEEWGVVSVGTGGSSSLTFLLMGLVGLMGEASRTAASPTLPSMPVSGHAAH